MGQGRKMKSPEIAPIVSGVLWGVGHEVERASYDVIEESYALGQVLICTRGEHRGAEVSAGRRACASCRRTSGHTCRTGCEQARATGKFVRDTAASTVRGCGLDGVDHLCSLLVAHRNFPVEEGGYRRRRLVCPESVSSTAHARPRLGRARRAAKPAAIEDASRRRGR